MTLLEEHSQRARYETQLKSHGFVDMGKTRPTKHRNDRKDRSWAAQSWQLKKDRSSLPFFHGRFWQLRLWLKMGLLV